ncbi:hypothetical protein [Pelosinus propionicus]|uniref:Lycopene cyclase domain-containing protein n=1 Tax=Pelosinus propionicus DSM 13327 TaxID=1123291 RepID=A0A1I4LS73_9FIRM|nr:hypothetical protein [Pelosinus propionicus]SFL93751.1 hypothetical protein SAMN04490355_102667 [Pelosinus propionicus DSM 13327]
MSNQTILAAIFILSWLSLFFMKKEDIKRFMPVGLFATITSAMILEAGITFGWWIYPVKLYPLQSVPYLYGPIPVATMWMLKFTYGRFWLYVGVDFLLNLLYTLVFEDYFLGNRGVIQFQNVSPMLDVFMTSALGVIIYAYQIWQDDIFVRSKEPSPSRALNLQPALKPFTHNDDDREK